MPCAIFFTPSSNARAFALMPSIKFCIRSLPHCLAAFTFSIIADFTLFTKLAPASYILPPKDSNPLAIASIICGTAFNNSGIASIKAPARETTRSTPADIIIGRLLAMVSTTSGIIVSDALLINVAKPCIVCSTRGIMFSPTVTALSTRLLTNCPKSALSSAMPTSRFSHAPFMDDTEP